MLSFTNYLNSFSFKIPLFDHAGCSLLWPRRPQNQSVQTKKLRCLVEFFTKSLFKGLWVCYGIMLGVFYKLSTQLRTTYIQHVGFSTSLVNAQKHTCGEFQVNGTPCSLIWTALVSRIFFRCLIFNYCNISICKKEKIKDETSKKIRETNGGPP